MARAPLSIVIPTLNAEAGLPACLASLTEGLSEGLIRELIVSDGGSTDATPRIAEQAGAAWITGPASRGGQLRRGCQAAQGTWLLVLHADTQLDAGWTQDAIALIESGHSAGYFRLGFRADGLPPNIVAAWANIRARLFRLPYGDQGLLIHRDAYERAGGYQAIPLMEDVALVRALSEKPKQLPTRARTSADKYQRQGWTRRGTLNIFMLLRYLAGADPHKLAREYTRKR